MKAILEMPKQEEEKKITPSGKINHRLLFLEGLFLVAKKDVV